MMKALKALTVKRKEGCQIWWFFILLKNVTSELGFETFKTIQKRVEHFVLQHFLFIYFYLAHGLTVGNITCLQFIFK